MRKCLTTKYFIKKAQKIHGNLYDYSKVVYINNKTPVIIICPIHDEFFSTPNNHLQGKSGCPKCNIGGNYLTLEDFIKKAKYIHGSKYDYSKVNYIGCYIKVIIICPIHGEFSQTPRSHLAGDGCLICSGKQRSTKEIFIERSKEIHGENRYDYSKVIYINNHTKVIIICPIDGEFFSTPNNHLNKKSGCPICRSSKGELFIDKMLKLLNVIYEKQKRFNDCRNPLTKHKLSYDFYIPQENLLIEFNGEQHYKNRYYQEFKKRGSLEDQQYRDSLKKDYALANGYKFLVIRYDEDIEKVLKTNVHPF
jgi:hypothetical protein